MRAMILEKPGLVEAAPLKKASVEKPEPGLHEILLRVQVCGVCHTDLHTVEGDLELPRLPIIPGHQIVGQIERIGKEVTRRHLGDYVGVPWLYSTCQTCEFCERGLENLCERAKFTGLHAYGGYAEYMVALENFVYSIPTGFSKVQAAPLFCAGIIGYRALKLSEIKPNGHLGLYGFGASAHIAIQVAKHWGCKVYVFTRSEEHRTHARELGAVWTGSAADTPPVLMESSVMFAPAGPLVIEALRILKKGGTLALAGIYMTPIPKLDYSLLYGERTVRSVANSTRQDATELLELAAEIPIQTNVEMYPLEDANEVLKRLKRSEIKGAAVLKIS